LGFKHFGIATSSLIKEQASAAVPTELFRWEISFETSLQILRTLMHSLNPKAADVLKECKCTKNGFPESNQTLGERLRITERNQQTAAATVLASLSFVRLYSKRSIFITKLYRPFS
jgi:hypothetical protein